jgi:hypothetical protein
MQKQTQAQESTGRASLGNKENKVLKPMVDPGIDYTMPFATILSVREVKILG